MNHKKRLLVVEDKPSTLAGTLRELEAEGFHCEVVGSVSEALTALTVGHWDALILDWSIPDAPGIEAELGGAHRLLQFLQTRATAAGKGTMPFIVVTAHPNVVSENGLRAIGGYGGTVYKLFMDDITARLLETLSTGEKHE